MADLSGRSESHTATDVLIRRTIAWRLALVGLGVGLVGIGIVFMMERVRISDLVLERSTNDARALEILTADALDNPSQLSQKTADQALDRLTAHPLADRHGQFDYVEFRLPSGEVLASRYSHGAARTGALGEAARKLDGTFKQEWDDARYGILRIAGERYVAVQTPLRNSKGEIAAYAQGLFHVSHESLGDAWHKAHRTVLILLLVVAAVVAVLYPVISSLMLRLGHAAVDLLDANLGTLEVLGSAIAKRDSDTDAHNYRVTIYATRLAETMGLGPEAIRSLIKGALMHDVGKIGIPDQVLLKPGRLTPEEFEIMKRHVTFGLDIVSHDVWLRDAADVVGFHHEKFDGSGYYTGRRATQIPLNARIFAVVDVFDALTSRRPYKEPLGYDETVAMLAKSRQSHFDPDVLDTFLGIAPGLYQKMTGGRDEDAKSDLLAIIRHYFHDDSAQLLR